MLVLSRKENEKIRIGNDIVITVVRLNGDKVRLGIEAPPSALILRDELRKKSGAVSQDAESKHEIGTVSFETAVSVSMEMCQCS